MTLPRSATMPRVRRDDAGTVLVSTAHVPDRASGSALLHDAATAWESVEPSAGLVSVGLFLSVDGATALAYAQCVDVASWAPYARAAGSGLGGAAVAYRLRRSVVLDPEGSVSCVVIATFDVDGPQCQAHIVDGICDAIEVAPTAQRPGLRAANFHVSTDGSRVLNYAEWSSDEAHEEFLRGATRSTAVEITARTPGIRPIGFTRYHLHAVLTR
ncbi:hypothetical protein [Micromonospora wenchangensis]|uniref:hypothetical protein n=1 Tax=Micromonospora wenchangensis TaxID=1185415 RepID=UPI00382ACBF6